MTGQKNDRRYMKNAWGQAAPSAAGTFSRPDLVIPHQVASQQSLTPFHQADANIHQGDVPRSFVTVVRSGLSRDRSRSLLFGSTRVASSMRRLRPTSTSG